MGRGGAVAIFGRDAPLLLLPCRLDNNDAGRVITGTGGGRAASELEAVSVFTVAGLVRAGLCGGVSSSSNICTKLLGKTPIVPLSLVPFHQLSESVGSTFVIYSPRNNFISSCDSRKSQRITQT
jgi:hypothetical protein